MLSAHVLKVGLLPLTSLNPRLPRLFKGDPCQVHCAEGFLGSYISTMQNGRSLRIHWTWTYSNIYIYSNIMQSLWSQKCFLFGAMSFRPSKRRCFVLLLLLFSNLPVCPVMRSASFVLGVTPALLCRSAGGSESPAAAVAPWHGRSFFFFNCNFFHMMGV